MQTSIKDEDDEDLLSSTKGHADNPPRHGNVERYFWAESLRKDAMEPSPKATPCGINKWIHQDKNEGEDPMQVSRQE
ncbi:hypothetical protein GOP47_0010757 [Adiantum capillus-veneris]|uniref:Uncharacterized protein n=1 Tax=Adiantum capillus-veneris TaxID=13818 RepID=A0A9D4UVM2_ADICA|nr:hypothetical protein GOP47_0010757 [Adiantum capillus-veneris]